MKQNHQMGLGNTVDETIEILHTGIIGRSAFGRISDLIAAWCGRTQSLANRPVSDLRLMIQALLEFAHPKEKEQLGQFEFAVEGQQILASVRFENRIFEKTDSIEKTLSQFWMASEEASMLKKVLYPKDRVEVRYNQNLNLVEWRVCRSLSPELLSHDDPSFLVILDQEQSLTSLNEHYTELGDLPYQEWLNSVYRNQSNKNRSGEVFVEGESLQNESEWARVVAGREADQIDVEARIVASHTPPVEDASVVFRELSAEEESEILVRSRKYVNDLKTQMLTEQAELKENTKEIILNSKRRELQAVAEMSLAQQKVKMFEQLLHKKEVMVQKGKSQIEILSQKLSKSTNDTRHSQQEPNSQSFKEKAIQMFAALKKVKEENQELEKLLLESQHREKNTSNTTKDSGGAGSSTPQHAEELNRKVERMQRAIETEKAKVKTLSERVIFAEKEAQSAAPMIDDLERKVETTLKVAQQHKKEAEQMKLKLVQAEAEKNKIKNEVVKAEAQIKTLLKRHAS